MAKGKITRREAIELITPVVDGEVKEEVRAAFLKYIREDRSVRLKYESAKRMKDLVSTRYRPVPAPESLKKRVRDFLMDPESARQADSGLNMDLTPDTPFPEEEKPGSKEPFPLVPSFSASLKNNRWAYATAASIVVLLMFAAVYLASMQGTPIHNVEEFAYRQFSTHQGAYLQPTIVATSPTDAELKLASNMGFSVTIPPIRNSELKGIVLSELTQDYKAPMLEYFDPEHNQYIYVFAFRINDLDNLGTLTRNPEAVEKCINPQDYYIHNINGKHVVSWKWNDIWYTAVSNHDGNSLASRIGTLQYSVNGHASN